MARKMREVTNRILDAIDAGTLSWEQVGRGALQYMNEDEVATMAHHEEFFLYEDEDEDEDDTPDEDDFFEEFNSVGSRHHY